MGNPEFEYAGLIGEYIQTHVEKHLSKSREAIDEMCRKMLAQTDTRYGVLVTDSYGTVPEDGTYKVSCETTMVLSPEVPYGEIHYIMNPASPFDWGVGPYNIERKES